LPAGGIKRLLPRDIDETPLDDPGSIEKPCYLMPEPENDDDYSFTGAPTDYPEEWLELSRDGSTRLRSNRRPHAAQELIIDWTGTEGERGNKTEVKTEPLELDAGDPNDLVRALKGIDFNKLVVLEDFHYLPQETQEQFSFALKTVHETSKITFLIVAVWREENRLIVYNGDLAGRVISVDADAWSPDDLRKVIDAGEALLNLRFPPAFKAQLIADSLSSVYVVQECCYKACKLHNVHETKEELFEFPETLDAQKLVAEVIQEQSARYSSFLTNFAGGFQDTQLEMYKWLLYPVLTSSAQELADGLSYRFIRNRIESKHPQRNNLNPGNLTQALQSVPALQAKKNIKPFVLDYDRSNLRLSVVDKGFLIWLAAQDRKQLLEILDLPTLDGEHADTLVS
jgi:hypothetical protein